MAARERDERRTRWLLGGAGIIAFAVLKTLDLVIDEDEITFAKLLLEILEFALTSVAVGAMVLLFQRFQRSQNERLELMRDLEMARAGGLAQSSPILRHRSRGGDRNEVRELDPDGYRTRSGASDAQGL